MTLRYWLSVLIMSSGLVTADITLAQIETLVMPGELIEGHADIEEDCSSCHQAFNRDQQRALCLDCHEDVAADVTAERGFHGLFPDARDDDCASCHTDHDGRSADIVNLDEDSFDHAFTDFELIESHLDTECEDCHEPEVKFRDAQGDCVGCHEDDYVHGDSMGTECADCHTPTEWPDARFDHDTTDYPLLGNHAETACLDCHEDQTFENTETTCYGCHAEDDAHDGRSGRECGNCHSPNGWDDLSFSHARDTNFALDGKHAELSCGDCHSEDPFDDKLETNCFACHEDDDNHERHFGQACESCHTSEDWPTVSFDHNIDTEHPLNGAHAAAECKACHVQPIFDVALQSGCLSCHQDDDAHDGTQGEVCTDCHNEETWEDNVFFDHDLTLFPLLGNHAGAECEDCHDSHVFKDAPSACASCHAEDDPHEDRFANNCAQCHNPVDWLDWQFDHNVQTTFSLDGAHIDVACEDCHRRALDDQLSLGSRCGDCHRADDVHDGEFGFDCGRCHSADSFLEVRSIQ
jgi:hypothetical protein